MKIRKYNRILKEHPWLHRHFKWCLNIRPSDPEKFEAALKKWFRERVRHVAFHPMTDEILASRRPEKQIISLPSQIGMDDELHHFSYARVVCFKDGDVTKDYGFCEVQMEGESIGEVIEKAESFCGRDSRGLRPAVVIIATVTRSYHQYVRDIAASKAYSVKDAERAWEFHRKSEGIGTLLKAYDIILL